MTTALLVNAKDRTITPFECNDYRDIVKQLPGGFTIARVFDNGDVLYVDDEALLRPATVAFRIKGRVDGQPMMSNGVLQGRDDNKIINGELVETTLDPAMTPEQLQEHIEWMTVEEALVWFRERSDAPATELQSGDDKPVVINRWRDFLLHLEGKEGGAFPGPGDFWR